MKVTIINRPAKEKEKAFVECVNVTRLPEIGDTFVHFKLNGEFKVVDRFFSFDEMGDVDTIEIYVIRNN